MTKYTLKNFAARDIEKGKRLLLQEDLLKGDESGLKEGESIALYTEAGEFLGRALIGRQNKGLGWIFTQEATETWNESLVLTRIQEALKRRQPFFELSDTNAFRLINGEGDGLGGVTVDWYNGYVQINWYSKGVYTYRDWFIAGLLALPLNIQGIYETQRFKDADPLTAIQHTWGEVAGQPHIIQENGVNYATYLGEDWMTGIFFDQREVRQFVKSQAEGLKVLNLFSYTGAFSVAAEAGGALQTVSVDVANRSLERTQEQFEINHLFAGAEQREIRVMDVFDYVRYALRHQLEYDLVICDPPSFARTKGYTFSASQDYARLAEDLFRLTSPGGMTLFSTNHSAYTKEKFTQDLFVAADQVGIKAHLIQSFSLPVDFPTTADETSQYLKVQVFYRES